MTIVKVNRVKLLIIADRHQYTRTVTDVALSIKGLSFEKFATLTQCGAINPISKTSSDNVKISLSRSVPLPADAGSRRRVLPDAQHAARGLRPLMQRHHKGPAKATGKVLFHQT